MAETGHYIPWMDDKNRAIHVTKFEEALPVSPHCHDFVELVIMGEGACNHTYNGIHVPLVPGDVFVVLPHEEHSYEISRETVIFNCLFYPEALGEEWETLKEIGGIFDFFMVEPSYRLEQGKQEILHLSPRDHSYAKNILEHMLDEQKRDQVGVDLILKADLVLLLVFLGRLWADQPSNQLKVFEGQRNLLKEAIAYIENNSDQDLKVPELAARTYLSPHYFRRIFKEQTGLTPLEYINRIRISRSVEYLKNSQASISEIAEQVGIQDPNYFARLFRRIIGCSPSDYRKGQAGDV